MKTKTKAKGFEAAAGEATSPAVKVRRSRAAAAVGGAASEASARTKAGEAASWQADGEGGIETDMALQAFEAIRAELEALPAGELVTLRVDLRRAGAIAHSVAVRDAAPERRAAFEKVATTGLYDIAALDALPRVARGAWHVRRQQLRVLARASGAAVSEEDVRLAYATRARMMRVLEHWLGDHRAIAEELEHLRASTGHEDLATDLDTLVEIYRRDDVRPVIERDHKHYRATDVTDALRLVNLLFASLGMVEPGETERANALARRAATLLLRTYDEHRHCGRFVFGRREDTAATYPSLISAARGLRRKRSDDARGGEGPSAEGPSGDEPGDEGPGNVDAADGAPASEAPVSAA